MCNFIAAVLQGMHFSSDLLHKKCEILIAAFANKSVTTTEKKNKLQHGMHAFLFLYLPVMFWFILHTLLLHVVHHFHAVRVKMVTNIQIIVYAINQNITHKAGFFLYKIKQVRAQKNAS